ncbi:carbohydrate binding family 9 domain-containing protein [Aliikangiella marina]|uniref:Carbohydrate binding family 9 domain-containing protein n=1 Tax=Aliikangiella marina TaxID=1712262 RepID=A0A545TI96_9GAMM|nr:carbohydrate binding family 9 domain-containing protein [Aliikangiella marina]TQV76896.1 carbohydrate binding family 9 domain-containing protein [Aliikangiella marina]
MTLATGNRTGESEPSNIICGKRFVRFFSCFMVCLLLCRPHVIEAAEDKSEITEVKIPKLTAELSLDGELTDSVWKSARQFDLKFEVEPAENIVAPQKTVAYLFEDGQNLYIGIEAYDTRADQIRAYLSDRDSIQASDHIIIKLDTFNDSRRAFEFAINPLGIQADSIIDEKSGNSDDSWDAIWYSAGRVTDSGYVIEIQIPFKALRFEESDTLKRWGISFSRIWPRNVIHEFSNAPRDRNISCEICQYDKIVGFENAQAPTNITLIPSLTLVESEARDVQAAVPVWTEVATEDKASLDFRWGISQEAYLNATINPDFSQVEADALQLDVNNLSALFLTEKRPFFQDGADFFRSWSRLVYTRIFEEPEYGVKLTGKSDRHSYAFMALEDKHTNLLIPYEYGADLVRLENYQSSSQIFRYSYDIGDRGNLGTTFTNREADGFHSWMLGIDGKYWFSDSDFIRFQVMNSETDYPQEVLALMPSQAASISGNAYSVNYTHQQRDWSWDITHHYFDEDFRADAGFISFGNWTRNGLKVNRFFYPEDESSWWKKFRITGGVIQSEEIDGTPIEDFNELIIETSAIYQSLFGFQIVQNDLTYIDESLLNQAQTSFDLRRYDAWLEFQPVAGLDLLFERIWGDTVDYSNANPAEEDTVIVSADYQISAAVNSELEFITQTLESLGTELYTVDITNLKVAYQINENSFVRLTLQHQDLKSSANRERLASQLIYSYKVNPFTLFYLGYSDRYRTQIASNDLLRDSKTLFMKFSYAWQL